MSAAHTPGPWSYVRNPENTRWIIDSRPAHAIACTAGHECDSEDNARLIAAAPALLEALQALVGPCLSYQGNSIVITCDSHGWALKRVHEARAAIAKALGRTPNEIGDEG